MDIAAPSVTLARATAHSESSSTHLSSTACRPSIHASVALSFPFVICCFFFPAACFGSTYPSHAAISRATPTSDVLPDQLFGKSRSPPSIAVDFPLHGSVSCSCSQKRWPGSAVTRSLVRFAAGTPSFVAIESPTLSIRRKICQYRHGFSHARSATMMDDPLTILQLEPMRMVTKLSRKPLRALEKSGHHKERTRKSQESFTVPVCVSHVTRKRERERGREKKKTRRETGTQSQRSDLLKAISMCPAPHPSFRLPVCLEFFSDTSDGIGSTVPSLDLPRPSAGISASHNRPSTCWNPAPQSAQRGPSSNGFPRTGWAAPDWRRCHKERPAILPRPSQLETPAQLACPREEALFCEWRHSGHFLAEPLDILTSPSTMTPRETCRSTWRCDTKNRREESQQEGEGQ